MKRSYIQLILKKPYALEAGKARLANEADDLIQTEAEAKEYRGATFVEDDSGCKELHMVYANSVACINFENEEGIRVNYDFPLDTLGRIKHF